MKKQQDYWTRVSVPLYKIGDIVVYPNRYFDKEKDGSMLEFYQSKIIESTALLETNDPDDIAGWVYITEHTDKELEDYLFEADIIMKL